MKKIICVTILVLVLLGTASMFICNFGFTTVEYTYSSEKLPAEFDGFRVAQVSDLHNRRLNDLADTVAEYSPDVILITGDLVGRSDTDLSVAVTTVKELCTVAPVYYSNGNHEAELDLYDELIRDLRSMSVQILDNSGVEIERSGAKIRICGASDPAFDNKSDNPEDNLPFVSANVKKAIGEHEDFTVLMAHRPEFGDVYEEHGADVVFAGHAHGGAVCLPFGKPVFAPGQGLFPTYTSGLHKFGDTALVISRGLGDSTVPFRMNCSYELVICTLEAE